MERIPEIKELSLYLGHITQQAHWVKLIQTVMNHYRSGGSYDLKNLTNTKTQIGLSDDVVRHYSRTPIADIPKTIMDQLAPLGLPEKYSQIFKSAFAKYAPTLMTSARENVPRMPSLVQFRWRTEISISTSSINRLLRPSILIQITLSNGHRQLLQLNIKQFHALRLGVALMLKEINDIENDAQINRDIKILPGITNVY